MKIAPKDIILFLACVALGAISILQYKSLQMTKEERFVNEKTTDELAADYITLYAKNLELTSRNQELIKAASDLTAAEYDEEELENIMSLESTEAKRSAGLLSVTGEGIDVTITPSNSVPITANMMIQFINEIKAAGASAIAINNQRVVPMTEIRDTYTGYTVNGESFFYEDIIRIRAIGSNVDLYQSLHMVGGILDKWEESNIDVHVDIVDNLIVPSLGDDQRERLDLLPFNVDTEPDLQEGEN